MARAIVNLLTEIRDIYATKHALPGLKVSEPTFTSHGNVDIMSFNVNDGGVINAVTFMAISNRITNLAVAYEHTVETHDVTDETIEELAALIDKL